MLGMIPNQRGQLLARVYMSYRADHPGVAQIVDVHDYLAQRGFTPQAINSGAFDTRALQPLLASAVAQAAAWLEFAAGNLAQQAQQAISEWSHRAEAWEQDAQPLIQRRELRSRRDQIREEREYAKQLAPSVARVQPLIVLVPADYSAAPQPGVGVQGVPPELGWGAPGAEVAQMAAARGGAAPEGVRSNGAV